MYGVVPNEIEMDALGKYYDIDEDHCICYLEFMRRL